MDVAAVNWRSKDILLGECKWGASNVGQEVLRALVDKTAGAVPGEDWQVHYALFARRGFTPAAMARARRLKAHLVTLDQIEADLREWMKKGA